MRPSAVLVECPVANVVKAVLNVPVIEDDAEQRAGIGPVPVERGQALGGVFGSCPGIDAFDRSADPDGLLSSVEIAATVPFGVRQVDRVAAAPFAPISTLSGLSFSVVLLNERKPRIVIEFCFANFFAMCLIGLKKRKRALILAFAERGP
ncbi:MAG: hypothetical protein OXC26_21265 [Albidovulum sp.]|nr:hypothetical protein [Albidovulum sp.]